jgi:hypothetical protein
MCVLSECIVMRGGFECVFCLSVSLVVVGMNVCFV